MFKWRDNFETICDAPLALIDADELDKTHPALDFLHYWQSLNGGNMPDRSQFSPQDIPNLLRWLMMFRRVMKDKVDHYHLFLQGNSAAEMTHGLLQGQMLHDFTASSCLETRRNVMRRVLETEKPAYANIIMGNGKSEFSSNVTVGAFPLSDPGKEPQIVMVPAPSSVKMRMYL